MDWRKYTSDAMAATVPAKAHHQRHAHALHASAPAISTATLSWACAMASSIPAMLSLRSSFVPRSKSVSLVAMRRERISAAVSPSGRPVLSRFAVSTESVTLPRSLAMLPVCRSTRALACAVFLVIGPIIFRACVGALWHEVRSIVAAIKARRFTRSCCHRLSRGQQQRLPLYCGASFSGRATASRLSHPPASRLSHPPA